LLPFWLFVGLLFFFYANGRTMSVEYLVGRHTFLTCTRRRTKGFSNELQFFMLHKQYSPCVSEWR